MLAIRFIAALIFVLPAAGHAGDAERGAKLWKQCKSCHMIGEGALNRVGPQLNGVYGRAVGDIETYRYSPALRAAGASGLVWDAKALDAFLTKPKDFLPGTRMSFRGFEKPEDRADLIAYLRSFSHGATAAHGDAPEVDLPPEVLAMQGDRDYGEYLAAECLTCHKAGGADEGIPIIFGWPQEDFVIALHAYKRKLRPHPVMQMVTGQLSNEEIASLAVYFRELGE